MKEGKKEREREKGVREGKKLRKAIVFAHLSPLRSCVRQGNIGSGVVGVLLGGTEPNGGFTECLLVRSEKGRWARETSSNV